MNDQLISNINSFISSVGNYLKMEYDSVYYERFSTSDMFDFIGSYYMGGSTVPEVARYIVDFINIRVDQ